MLIMTFWSPIEIDSWVGINHSGIIHFQKKRHCAMFIYRYKNCCWKSGFSTDKWIQRHTIFCAIFCWEYITWMKSCLHSMQCYVDFLILYSKCGPLLQIIQAKLQEFFKNENLAVQRGTGKVYGLFWRVWKANFVNASPGCSSRLATAGLCFSTNALLYS